MNRLEPLNSDTVVKRTLRTFFVALLLSNFYSLLSAPSAFAALVSATFVPPNNLGLNSGLTGHWTFDGKDMKQNVADTSGSGYNGSFLGGATSTTAGIVGQALNFFGTGRFVTTETPLSSFMSASVGSMSVWIYVNSFTNVTCLTPTSIVMDSDRTGGLGGFAWIGVFTDSVCVGGNDGSNVTLSTSLTLKKWTHVVWIHNNNLLYMYKDGALIGSTALGDIADPSHGITFNRSYASNKNYNGYMDDVRIYNRALSATEVKELYNMGGNKISATPPKTSTGLESGLLAHYTFDGKDMKQNVVDTSGNANTGYLFGGATTTVAAKVGQGLKFNGTTNYIKINNQIGITGNLTYSLWMKRAGSITSPAPLVAKTDGTGVTYDSMLYLKTTGAISFLDDVVVTGANNSTSLITDTNWHHAAVVRNGTSLNLYVDGQSSGTFTISSGSFNNGNIPTFIGSDAESFFPGSLDDVRIYNRALSATEVKELYNMGGSKIAATPPKTSTGLESGLLAHYTFDGKDMIRNVADTSGNGNTGYLIAVATTTVAGKIGQGLRFYTGLRSVRILSRISITADLTYAAWIRISGNNSVDIISKNNGASYDSELYFDPSHQRIGFYDDAVLSEPKETPDNSVTANVWHHLAFVRNGTSATFYVDGVQSGSANVIGSGAFNDHNVETELLYAYGDNTDDIDDARIYNRALSASEVKQLYNMGR